MNLTNRKSRLLQQLAAIPDPHQRLLHLSAEARKRPGLPVEQRIADNLIEGCVAELWLVAEYRDNRCWFNCDSESLTVKAMAGLLCDLYSGLPPEEILANEPTFLRETGLGSALTANRRSALSKVWKQIKTFARDVS